MGFGGRRGVVRGVFWAGLLAGLTAVGCGDDSPARKAPHVPLARGPALPAPSVSEPLPDVPGGVEHSPLTLEAPPMGYLVDARILVISPDGSDSELAAIRQTLAYLGVRYDVFVATTAPTLTMANLTSDPMHGFYNGIILTRGSMVLPSGGTSAFTAAEFQTLSNYEAQFQVRRVSLYTRPDAGYGYTNASANNSFTMSTTVNATCTQAGRAIFPYVNCNNVVISGAAGFRAVAADAATVAVLTDSSGGVLAATRAYGDGREAMSLNFAQSPSLEHTLQLFHGVVSWATRGVFLGERHAYIGVQIDDLFLPDDIYPNTGATYRMSANDLQNAYDYTQAKRAQAVTSGLRYHWAYNGVGLSSSDGLTQAERLGHLEVGDGAWVVAADLEADDDEIGAIERLALIGEGLDRRLGAEGLDQLAGDDGAFFEALWIDVHQRNLCIAQRVALQHVTDDVLHEHGGASANERDLGVGH